MTDQRTIITLTMNPTIDKSTSVERVAPEIKLRAAPPRFDPGGGGINVSRAIDRMKGQSTALYLAGGTSGAMLRDLLDEEGIAQQPLMIEGRTRESFTVFEETTEQQYRFGEPGPHIDEAEWQSVLDHLRQLEPHPAYIVASGSLPPGVPVDFYGEVARVAKERDAQLVLDASGEPLRQSARIGVYLLKPNLRELEQLTGRDTRSDDAIQQAARQLISDGYSDVVVVSLGAAGAALVTAASYERLRAPVVPIRSKVGAGDTMVAGIVLSLARGWSLPEAVQYGVAAGSATVMSDGTQLCRYDDVQRLYHEITGNGQS